jgi:hypothetical protein
MFSIYANNKKVVYGQKDYLVDDISDLSRIPTDGLVPGTTAFVISASQLYMLNHSKVWVKVNANGGGSSSPDSPEHIIYDGGKI